MSKNTGYSGYYFENAENPRILIATYNEEKARENPDDPEWGWHRPYGDKEFSPGPEDILRQEKVAANGDSGTVYYKVTLSSDFLEANGIEMLPPSPKYPRALAGWDPYKTEKGFFEQLGGFSGKTAIGALTRRLEELKTQWGPVQKAFELVEKSQKVEDLSQVDAFMDEARMHLQYLVIANGYGINSDLEAALPPFLAKPKRARDEGHLDDGQVWRFRTLYGLVLAIVDAAA